MLAAATYFDDAVALTRQMRELNVNPKMYGVTVGGDLPEFYDAARRGPPSTSTAPRQWEATLPYPGQPRSSFEAYMKEFKHEPCYHSAAGYAGCMIYAEGVKRAGTLDADKVREALLKLEIADDVRRLQGRQGRLSGRRTRWSCSSGRTARRSIVWPDDLASGKPRFPTPPWNAR